MEEDAKSKDGMDSFLGAIDKEKASRAVDGIIEEMDRSKPPMEYGKIRYDDELWHLARNMDAYGIADIPDDAIDANMKIVHGEDGKPVGIALTIAYEEPEYEEDGEIHWAEVYDEHGGTYFFSEAQLERIDEKIEGLKERYPVEKSLWYEDYLTRYEGMDHEERSSLAREKSREVDSRFVEYCNEHDLIPDYIVRGMDGNYHREGGNEPKNPDKAYRFSSYLEKRGTDRLEFERMRKKCNEYEKWDEGSPAKGKAPMTFNEYLETSRKCVKLLLDYEGHCKDRGLAMDHSIEDAWAKEFDAMKTKAAAIDGKSLLGVTKDGQEVYISREALAHMEAHPDVDMSHVKEAIGLLEDYNGQFRIGPVDLGRTVGTDRCVEVTGDMAGKVQMAYRKGRDGMTPVLYEEDGHKPAATSKVTLGIAKDDDGKHTLFTAFYGDLAPKEPWDKSLSDDGAKESKSFWDKHAIVVTRDMVDHERTDAARPTQKAGVDLEGLKGLLKATRDGIDKALERLDKVELSPGVKEQAQEMREARASSKERKR